MRKATLLFLVMLALAVFAIAQTSTTAPANQGSTPTTSNPNAPASPNPSNPQSTMPPDTSATSSTSQSNTTPAQAGTTNNQTGATSNNMSGQSSQTSQPGTTSQSQTAAGGEIAAGAEIRATLDTPLSTKTSKVGDTFTATVVEPVQSSNGQVAVPAGAKISGEVTEAEQGKTLPALRGKGKLNMHFRDIQLPDGTSIPLSATLVSVNSTKGGTKASTGSEGEVQSGNTGTHTAKDVGIGAGAGTIAGLIFGSALKGLAIGAIAGGGYVLATNGKEVQLPAQTGLRLRVDHNLSVPANSATH